jgi:hypothetical protein
MGQALGWAKAYKVIYNGVQSSAYGVAVKKPSGCRDFKFLFETRFKIGFKFTPNLNFGLLGIGPQRFL